MPRKRNIILEYYDNIIIYVYLVNDLICKEHNFRFISSPIRAWN